jgi:hypothetical protein
MNVTKWTALIVVTALAFLVAGKHSDVRDQGAAVADRLPVTLVQEARADDADLGLAILKCFHPTADFVRANLGQPYQDSAGRITHDGRIDFRGGFSGKEYVMEFVMHVKSSEGDTLIRVTPGTDTAPFPPNPSCRLRDWTRIH